MLEFLAKRILTRTVTCFIGWAVADILRVLYYHKYDDVIQRTIDNGGVKDRYWR